MDWMKIGWAILLGAMIIYLLPRAKEMMKNSPEGSTQDWMAALIPIAAVGLLIVLLVMMV